MKILKLSLATFILLQLFITTFALRNICRIGRRQMTPGQTRTDCYSIVTCNEGGIISRKNSCPRYICEHKLRGYEQFDHRKPYPDCCGGPICDDIYKHYFYKP